MINGLYSGATAMDIYSQQQGLISANLAHLNTTGHKRIQFSFAEKSATDQFGDYSTPGTHINETFVDFSQGRMDQTGRPLDLAIQGDAFFTIQGENERLYTRNGAFVRGAGGELLTNDGLPVLGTDGPISIPPDVESRSINVDFEGNISAGGRQLGQLEVTAFTDNQQLSSESQIYFRQGNAEFDENANFEIKQGMREMSNASPIDELVSLIVGSRNHEAAQRVMRTISESIQQSIRE